MDIVTQPDARGQWGVDMLKALGMEGQGVTHILIDIAPLDGVTVIVTKRVYSDNTDVPQFEDIILRILEKAE